MKPLWRKCTITFPAINFWVLGLRHNQTGSRLSLNFPPVVGWTQKRAGLRTESDRREPFERRALSAAIRAHAGLLRRLIWAMSRVSSQPSPALKTSSSHDISAPRKRFAMEAGRRAIKSIMPKAAGRCFWRWPLVFGLALAMIVSLFHDLPALAGMGGSDPIPVAAVSSSAGTPVQTPDSQAPGIGCHCLCHMTTQSTVSPVVTPLVFNDSLYPPVRAHRLARGRVCPPSDLPASKRRA
jgi:hypothetical protein